MKNYFLSHCEALLAEAISLFVWNLAVEIACLSADRLRLKSEARNDTNTDFFSNLLDVTQEISRLAADLVFRFVKSNSLQIPDAFIAATALAHNSSLLTYNIKDFRYIPSLQLHPAK